LVEIEDKISSYRVVHYRPGITDFVGDPATADIFSINDALGSADNGDNTVRMSNIYVDPNATRPSIEQVILRPVVDAESIARLISGIHYYNGSSDLFDIELKSNTDVFSNTYLSEDILNFTTDIFSFPGEGDGYGQGVDVESLLDDGYVAFSSSNLPLFADRAFYFANATFNTSSRIFPESNKFSNNAHIVAGMADPFGAGDTFDAYGVLTPSGTDIRLLVNSFSATRATDTTEWFTDESRRVGTSETFDFELDIGQFTGAGAGGTLDAWDSTTPLSSGELQCGGFFDDFNSPGLVFPQEDFTGSIRPTQQGGTDYSGFSSDSTYQRLFSFGVASNGGRLRIMSSGSFPVSFEDIDASNSSRSIKFEVKVPGTSSNSTGFMDLGKLFETGLTEDGYGALSGPITGGTGDFTVPFTFGIINTADTGNLIAVRITHLSAEIADAKTRVISLVQLLET